MANKLNQFTTHSSQFTNFAFTLAETLIVMGIIGVVAALTLPNLNSSTVSNLVNNVQGADFQDQLKGINDELKKYDHVEGFKDSQEANTLKEGSVQSTKQTISGLKSLGLDLSTVTAQDEGKIKARKIEIKWKLNI